MSPTLSEPVRPGTSDWIKLKTPPGGHGAAGDGLVLGCDAGGLLGGETDGMSGGETGVLMGGETEELPGGDTGGPGNHANNSNQDQCDTYRFILTDSPLNSANSLIESPVTI